MNAAPNSIPGQLQAYAVEFEPEVDINTAIEELGAISNKDVDAAVAKEVTEMLGFQTTGTVGADEESASQDDDN